MAYGQCIPDFNLPYNGLSPRDLPKAKEGVMYDQKIHFKWPQDTTLGMGVIKFDSLKLLEINNLHSSIAWVTDTFSNSWAGGEAGCIRFQGTPPQGSANNDSLEIKVRAFFKIFGNTTYSDFKNKVAFGIENDTATQTGIEYLQQTGIREFQTYWDGGNQALTLQWVSRQAQQLECRILDLQGKIIYKQPVFLQAGQNFNTFYLTGVTQGIYLMQINSAQGQATTRFYCH